ncbi:hypothetical protein GYMLUDRAFT_256426 [Collybiopsis luxurians FD-317 M1]|nr:hypothetical protein GYMLUDRAFT_256426 [Collybiopsis luxurians FD-317 M1]
MSWKSLMGSVAGLYILSLTYFGVQMALRITIFNLDNSASLALHEVLRRHGGDSFSLPVLEGQSLLLCSSRNHCRTLPLTTITTISTTAPVNAPTPSPTYTSAWASVSSTVASHSTISSIRSASPVLSLSTSATFKTSSSSSSIFSSRTVTQTSTKSTASATGVEATASLISGRGNGDGHHGGGQGGRGGDGFQNNNAVLGFLQDGNISTTCVDSLSFPVYKLDNAVREDIALVILQVWVLFITFVALNYRSISWTITTFVCLVFQIIWFIFRIVYAGRSQAQVDSIIHTTCGAERLLSGLWSPQKILEIPSIILGGVGLILLVCFAYKLYASSQWNDQRLYLGSTEGRWIVGLHIVIQISMFFVMLPLGLWLNDLLHGVSAHLADHVEALEALAFIEALVFIPWLIALWSASHQGHPRAQLLLAMFSLLYVVGLTLIFISETYRLVFTTWPFFGTTTVVSTILCLGLLVAGLGLSQKRRPNAGTAAPSSSTFSKRESLSSCSIRSNISSSSSGSSKVWIDVERTTHSDVESFSIYSSEESFRGLINARPPIIFPPIDTRLERQLTAKEDSPTLKTPRVRAF